MPWPLVEAYVSGIPCSVYVTNHTEDCFEFELYDRKGYRAKWLETKATVEDIEGLQEAYISWYREYYSD